MVWSGQIDKLCARYVSSGASQPRPMQNAKVESQRWGSAHFGCAAEADGHERQVTGSPVNQLASLGVCWGVKQYGWSHSRA